MDVPGDAGAAQAHKKLNAQETEFLRAKIAKLPEGRLKTALLHTVHPEQAKKHAAPSRRRGSVINMHAFASALETVVSDSYDVLLTLDLGGLEIGCEGCLSLAELLGSPAMRRLRHLDLSCNKLTDLGSNFSGLSALATALKKNRVLTSLNLARNSLSKQGGGAIARCLKENGTIQFLDLSRNNLRAEGLEAIAKAMDMKNNPRSAICMLDLSANNLTNFSGSPDGAIALSSAVSTHKNLTCLDLCHSRMSKAALSALVYGLRRNRSLIDLRLDDNKVDMDTAHQLAEALAMNRSLTRLGLFNNTIFNDGAVAIARVLARNPVLQLVDMRQNYVTAEGRMEIAAIMHPDFPAVRTGAAGGAVDDATAAAKGAGGEDSDDEVPAALKSKAAAAAGAAESKGDEEEEHKGEEVEPAVGDKRAPAAPAVTGHTAHSELDFESESFVLHNSTTGHTLWL